MPVTYIEGIKPCQDAKVAIVVSRFNSFICERLLEGALDTLKREGQVSEDNITVVRVPGAIEIPVALEPARCTASSIVLVVKTPLETITLFCKVT